MRFILNRGGVLFFIPMNIGSITLDLREGKIGGIKLMVFTLLKKAKM